MKKTAAILLALLLCCTAFTGCGKHTPKNQGQDLTVYSFCGENEQFKISNGVIVLSAGEEIFYGGDLEEKQGKLSDLSAYTMTFYIRSGSQEETVLSNRVEDMTGEAVNISSSTGKISGASVFSADLDALQNNLYFELETTTLSGEQNTYQLQLTLTEVTEKAAS